MKTIFESMKKKKNGISEDLLPLFENILNNYTGDELDNNFYKAMEQHLTQEERFRLFEQNGACNGKKLDPQRKLFELEHANKPLFQRLELFSNNFGRTAVLNEDNTITVTFACKHGYYKHAPKGKFKLTDSIKTYFERCAGGRLYECQKALGVKLKLKSVDISPLKENISNPVVFTFEVIE